MDHPFAGTAARHEIEPRASPYVLEPKKI